MIATKIEFNNLAELIEQYGTAPGRLEEALYSKMQSLTAILHGKVAENLGGKVLKSKTGELLGRVREDVRREEDSIVGEVFMSPEDAKAAVHEKGGTKFYPIVPIKARMLHFLWQGREVYTRYVNHPPLQRRSYLQSALDEMPEQVYEAFLAAVDEALSA